MNTAFFLCGYHLLPSFKHSQRDDLIQALGFLSYLDFLTAFCPSHKPDCGNHRAGLLITKFTHRIYKLIQGSSTFREVSTCQSSDLSRWVSWFWCCIGLSHWLHGVFPLADVLLRDNRLSVVVHFASCFGLGCFKEDSSLSLSLDLCLECFSPAPCPLPLPPWKSTIELPTFLSTVFKQLSADLLVLANLSINHNLKTQTALS